jgi:deoxycytidylate deaminase
MTKFDVVMMKTAELWAEQSYCKRKKVGAVLSSEDGRILATGYNGTISGTPNNCEEYKPIEDCKSEIIVCPKCDGKGFIDEPYNALENKFNVENEGFLLDYNRKTCDVCKGKGKVCNELITNEFTLHAEQNIITYCAKNGIPMKNTILYVTLSPCKTCSKLIIQSGIIKVVFKELYRDKSGVDFLVRNGVDVYMMNDDYNVIKFA